MRKIILFISAVLSAGVLNAQVFEKGSNHINVGYGFGLGTGRLLNAYSSYEGYKFSGFGPVFGGFERGITDNIGVGVTVSYSSYGGDWTDQAYNFSTGGTTTYNYKYRWTTLGIMARGAYHFSLSNDKFDPYAGVGIGFLKYGSKWTSDDPDFDNANYNISFGTPLGYQIFAGARYLFTDNIGAYAEVGYGISVANFGLTFKF